MREKSIESKILELIKKATAELPREVVVSLKEAYARERNEIAKLQLKNILDNASLARRLELPMCQDTGLPIFYVALGKNHNRAEIERAICSAVKKATKLSLLRSNVVDCLSRENIGNNLGSGVPIIDWELSDKKTTEIIFLPKGSGAENMSALKMLKPGEGMEGVKNFVLEAVKSAGGKPCPPVILGVGIGGSFELAAKLAKHALLRPLNSHNKSKKIANMEKELLKEVNSLGIGPMGLGGATTCLKVNIEAAPCHTASLPVAVNFQCWAHRYAKMKI